VGALVAVVVVGTITTAVMECICELDVLWPVPNAMVQYVKAFVDEDLGIAVGIMYW
jgi:yeast amino acid transporter